MIKEVNICNLEKYPYDMDDPPFDVNLIEDLTSEHSEEIKLEAECDAELESKDYKLDEIVIYYWVGIKRKFIRSKANMLDFFVYRVILL